MNVEQHGPALSSLAGNKEIVSVTSCSNMPVQQTRSRKISPLMWRLALMLGDYLFLLLALASLLLLIPLFHPHLYISWSEPSFWRNKLIWVCIALISWSIAVTIVQAQDLRRAANRFKSSLCAILALLLMTICWLVLIYPFIAERPTIYITALLLFLVVAAPLIALWRIALANVMNRPAFRPRAAIIGRNLTSTALIDELQNAKRPPVTFLGYIDENVSNGTQQPQTQKELPVLGGKATWRQLAEMGLIDVIIMASDYQASRELFLEAIETAQLGVSIVPIATLYERSLGKIPVEHINDQWYAALPAEYGHFVSPLYLCWRKCIDLAFGLCGACLLFLILPVAALLIRLDSPGPIFYSQPRLGYRGRPFWIYKFRSMYIDAEKPGRPLWSQKHDARVTRIGRFMRATHLDELPQVINILRGEMSLIGPRPEREEFVLKLEKTVPFYRCRLMVVPGLTGWAQIKYHYGNTDRDTLVKLQHDLYYIKHQAITLDIFILLKTIQEILLYRGV